MASVRRGRIRAPRIDFASFRSLLPLRRAVIELVALEPETDAENLAGALGVLDLVSMSVAHSAPDRGTLTSLIQDLARRGWLLGWPGALVVADQDLEIEILEACERERRDEEFDPAIDWLSRKDRLGSRVSQQGRTASRVEGELDRAFARRKWDEYLRLEREAVPKSGGSFQPGASLHRQLQGAIDLALLESMPTSLRERALRLLLVVDAGYLRTTPGILSYASECAAREGEAATEDVRLAGAYASMYRGRLEEALAFLGPSPDQYPVGSRIRFLAGDIQGALDGFESILPGSVTPETLEEFEGWDVPYYVLALLASRDPSRQERALDLTRALRSSQLQTRSVYEMLYALVLLSKNGRLSDTQMLEFRRSTIPKDLMGSHIRALSMVRIHDLDFLATDSLPRELPALVETTATRGLTLYAAEFAEILAVVSASTRDGSRHHQRAGILRRQVNVPSTFETVPWVPFWERKLDRLIATRPVQTGAPSSPTERLIWVLSSPDELDPEVEPVLQKVQKRGGWSKGRKASEWSLLARSRDDPVVTDHDRRVLDALAWEREREFAPFRSRRDGWAPGAEFMALVGHPRVFWEDRPDQPVEVSRGEPRVEIRRQEDQLTLRIVPAVSSARDRFILDFSDRDRLIVYEIEPDQAGIATILGGGLTVPLAAEGKVLEAIHAIAPRIALHSDIGEDLEGLAEVPADATLHVQLSPWEGGLKVALRVQPFGSRGALHPPGEGGKVVISTLEGRRTRTVRDLAAERQALSTLLARCPTFANEIPEGTEGSITGTELCLELLSELRDASDGVRVEWPEGEPFRVTAAIGPNRLALAVREKQDYFAVNGTLSVDEGQVVELKNLLGLLERAEGRFVPLEDGRFLALTREFRRRLEDLRALGRKSEGPLQIHPLAAPAFADLLGEIAVDADPVWQANLERLQRSRDLRADVPSTLEAELRPYQIDGFRWLARLAAWGAGACLADDMGLGKTLQTLAVLLRRRSGGPALVVAPTSVVNNWIEEMRRFTPSIEPRLLARSSDIAMLEDPPGPGHVMIVSYTLLHHAIQDLVPIRWHTLVLDEAQAVKNPDTQRSRATIQLVADWRLALTGTPIENHLSELWSLFRFLNPGLLGTLESFRRRYALPIERDQNRAVQSRLKRLVTPFVLRRTKSQVLEDLPPKTEITRKVLLDPPERAFYEAVRRQALERLEEGTGAGGEDQRIRILAEIMRLRRACCHPRLVLPESDIESTKLKVFGEIVEELIENRHRSLVFSQFVGHLALIREWLDERDIRYEYLDGSTPVSARRKAVTSFQDGSAPLFLISLKAGGLGLNLTGADYVIHMDPWWNPAVEDQASDRAHRIGQIRPVTIYRIVAQDTVEERIMALHHEKRDLADRLLEGTEQARSLSVSELMTLLREEA